MRIAGDDVKDWDSPALGTKTGGEEALLCDHMGHAVASGRGFIVEDPV